jgi:O-antigen/teichoic acid export membrane protein
MGQMSVAAGVFILSGAGSPAAAGVLAACVRLLTGLNAINGIIATAMYPRLSQIAVAGTGADTALTALALRLIALVGAVATAVCVLAGDTLINAFIGVDSGRAATALVMTTAASLPLGSIIMYSYQLVARGNERDSLVPFGIGAGTTIGCGVFAVILFGPRVDLVAGTLLAGQLLGTAILARRVARRCPEIAGAAARSMRIALLVALLALGSLVDGWALPAGLLLGGLVVTMLAGFLPMAGRLLSGRG